METEKYLCLGSIIAAGLVVLIFLLDAAIGVPFGRKSILLDILFLIGGGLILWQGLETYRDFK
jgi:hypothetical protein